MKHKQKLAREHARVTVDELCELSTIKLESLYSRTKELSFLDGFEAAKKLMFERDYIDAEDVGEEEVE